MKQKLLLTLLVAAIAATVSAQKKDQKTTTAYAITGAQKGSTLWGEVRLIDISTGQEVKQVFTSKNDVEILNARTGKAVVKKDITANERSKVEREMFVYQYQNNDNAPRAKLLAADVLKTTPEVKLKEGTVTIDNITAQPKVVAGKVLKVRPYVDIADTKVVQGYEINSNTPTPKVVIIRHSAVQTDKPFATSSAALAYDQKHERLYYTPLGINQLRYIDLKSNTVNYFEDEPFGVVAGPWDAPNQITRMVIGSDGNGYALSNNGEHLIQFTTKKKPKITDLGAITDDAANGAYSVHSSAGFGGDMVADDKGNFYLINANKTVFKIDGDSKVATYKGTIKGLPRGFSTNGAVVQEGTTLIVSSANSTDGYYRFDLNTMQGEKVETEGNVYNASDLANATLVSKKKKKKDKEPVLETKPDESTAAGKVIGPEAADMVKNNVVVYPNPVAMGGTVRLSFIDQPKGNYMIQFMDISGKLIDSKQVTISNKMQVEEYKLPTLSARGNYLIKITGDSPKPVSVNTIVVQ